MKPGKSATRDYHPAKRRSPPLPCGGARGVAFGCGGRFATGSREISRPGPADGRPSAPAATEGHVSRSERPAGRGEGKTRGRLELSRDAKDVELRLAGRAVRLTNLKKLFWPELGLTKRDLLQYYADVAPALLPHLKDRAMVMKRYPHGASGEFFFMKRAPMPRPDYLHFDLDPVPGADFQKVIATALLVVNTNPHPLGRFRAIGPASNLQEFARAFACKPGDPMVRADRCKIW